MWSSHPTPQPLDPPWGPPSSVWLSGSKGAGSFPGSNILALVTQVSLHLRSSVDALLERNRWVGQQTGRCMGGGQVSGQTDRQAHGPLMASSYTGKMRVENFSRFFSLSAGVSITPAAATADCGSAPGT